MEIHPDTVEALAAAARGQAPPTTRHDVANACIGAPSRGTPARRRASLACIAAGNHPAEGRQGEPSVRLERAAAIRVGQRVRPP